MGLKNSQHVGMIRIDPRDSNTISVAAQGPLWSGGGDRGLYKSTDGGKNWRNARIDGPSWEKSMHRFYFEFDWDGSPLLLQSRAVDSSGYVQPTKSELRAVRGENSIYHNNGIQTWHVRANGEAENVEVS